MDSNGTLTVMTNSFDASRCFKQYKKSFNGEDVNWETRPIVKLVVVAFLRVSSMDVRN